MMGITDLVSDSVVTNCDVGVTDRSYIMTENGCAFWTMRFETTVDQVQEGAEMLQIGI
jgi:hypothetical protein